MNQKRIVITGMGVISPVGNGVDRFWQGLTAGKYGIETASLLDEKFFSNRLYGLIKDFDFTPYAKFHGRIGRASAFGIEAAREALSQAKLADDDASPLNRTGVTVGSLAGEVGLREEVWIKHGWNPELERAFTYFTAPLVAQNIAGWFGLKGPNSTISTACSSAAYAIAEACEILRNELAAVMLVGGVESVSLPGHGNFIRINALDPEKIRPFDKERKGTIIGEGAGMMAVESLDAAVARGVPVLAEIKGVGISCDGYHESAPDPSCRQMINAMRRAVEDASLSLDSIDCISAHGTGTYQNDRLETKAIKELFGERAAEIAITANKSMLGHGIGSACAVSAIAAVLMIRNNLVVPTINYEHPDPECDLNYTVNTVRRRELNHVMINSYGFGGNNGSVIISRFNG
jgi:3-oxoacyl-[acyl-carrier-protein] synthase II